MQPTRTVNLALQGGGAHGAFTWGVLDRFLEDDRIEIDGITGTSAGAVNGAVLLAGMLEDGRAGGRAMLRRFWERAAEAGRYSLFRPTAFDKFINGGNLDYSPAFQALDLITRMMSPYQLNPLDINPLRDILKDLIDFDRLKRSNGIKLFVCATNVRSGKIRVFPREELSVDALLASACLPHLFRAVEIDGEHYWDGGFMGNPAMFPLLYHTACSDIVLVEINPIRVEEVPETARAILDRMNSISFNSTMMREMRNIAFVTQMLDEHQLTGRSHLRRINFHIVEAERTMTRYGANSKFNVDLDFLNELFELGRATAQDWLDRNFNLIGVKSSIDLQELFF
ncbi:MAG: patatin-like phospholipase family protein [Alphaproteobacteria bacterium]|nr:patatin-like phospholipase family protein [Alphaproteobacteria bacterium]